MGTTNGQRLNTKKQLLTQSVVSFFLCLSREITMQSKAVRGDINSPTLKAAMDKARKENMPKDNIDRAVAKGAGAGAESYEQVMFEGFGPGGVAILMVGITDNNNRTSSENKTYFFKSRIPNWSTWKCFLGFQ